MSPRGEFDIIARYFAPLSRGAAGAYGLTDDAAVLAVPNGMELVVTADAIVAGVHFLPDDPPDTIARKLLRVNLSDLAAKGAQPLGYMLAAAFPKEISEGWIAAFAKGLKQDQAHFAVALLGGDTVSTPGPVTFSVTMFGLVPVGRMVRRAGARPGDLVCVSGTIGDGGFGLAELQRGHDGLSAARRKFLIGRYRLPQPRVRLAAAIQAHASAALDVSDGLVQDLGHLADISSVGLTVEIDRVPLSPAGLDIARHDPGARLKALTAGDDYEIAFTLPPKQFDVFQKKAAAARVAVRVIGRVDDGAGVRCVDHHGLDVDPGAGGFDHFAAR